MKFARNVSRKEGGRRKSQQFGMLSFPFPFFLIITMSGLLAEIKLFVSQILDNLVHLILQVS